MEKEQVWAHAKTWEEDFEGSDEDLDELVDSYLGNTPPGEWTKDGLDEYLDQYL